jgi:hypothetical protein
MVSAVTDAKSSLSRSGRPGEVASETSIPLALIMTVDGRHLLDLHRFVAVRIVLDPKDN